MSHKARILNVDDDEIGRFAITQMLRAAGFEVEEATNGADALRMAGTLPDLILLDVRMPDMDGFEVCRLIKSNPKTAGITVLHLSATQVDSQAIAHGLNWGADGYLTEPVAQAELIATVRAFLRIRQAEASQRFLAEASGRLAGVLDPNELLRKLASIAAEFFNTLCVVDTIDEQGALHTVAAVWTPAGQPERELTLDRDFSVTDDPGVVQVARDGRAMIGRAHSDRARMLRSLAIAQSSAGQVEELPANGIMSAPLIARARNLGVISIAPRANEPEFNSQDLAFLEELASRSALLVDNARLYAQAQAAIATRENMLAVVSHDLKDPLNSLVMGCEMLQSTVTDPATQRRLEIMRRSARRMDHLIHDLLDLASLDRGTFSVSCVQCTVDPLVNEVIEAFQPLAVEKDISLTREIAARLPQLPCDRNRVHQVLSNLLSNALKFTPKGGRVSLTAAKASASNHIVFRVTDTGPGIPADQLPHVFDHFWQASRTSRLGTGLGLSIAKGIVEAHGGTLRAESTVGVGSSFEFALPVDR